MVRRIHEAKNETHKTAVFSSVTLALRIQPTCVSEKSER
jgi:hypothetical protein